MKIETVVNNPGHYLLCNYRFSEKTIEVIKQEVQEFMHHREKDSDYFKFIKWQKKQYEIVVLTMYAYDDIQLPKTFDIIFQVDNPDNYIQTSFTITQAVINGWLPINQISKGQKHICVVEFNNAVPYIFKSIPLFEKGGEIEKYIQLGFCDMADFDIIKKSNDTHRAT